MFLHSNKKLAGYLSNNNSQYAFDSGVSSISFFAYSNSTITVRAAKLPIWGSTGPKLECFPINISLHEHAIKVPADIAIWE